MHTTLLRTAETVGRWLSIARRHVDWTAQGVYPVSPGGILYGTNYYNITSWTAGLERSFLLLKSATRLFFA